MLRRRPPIGRRRRRLQRVTLLLSVVALAGGIAGFLLYRASRPEVRRPGEALPEITEKLSRDLPEDAPRPLLTDVTVEAGLGGFRSFVGHRTSQLPEDMGSGAAWGDMDGDGDDDLFLVSVGGALGLADAGLAPCSLYENLGDGTFRRRDDFPDTRIRGMAAAWGDYDGDGRLDLVVSGYRALRLFRNLGEGRFARSDALPELDGYWAGASWADFDGDRDLDLYVSGYVRYVEEGEGAQRTSQQYGKAVPYTLNPASYEPERNLLFRNRGDGTFVEEAQLWGISNPEGRSLGALWHDFDADGRLDLYIANDISDNALYLNRGETFEDSGLASWVADYRGAMGLAVGDWNRDGDDDLFVTHWIAQENALYDSQLAGRPPGVSMPVTFRDLAAPLGLGQIALHLIGWGTEFADLDGDGWLDLAVVNGSTFETDEEPKRLKPQPTLLLWNRRGEHFHDLAPLHPSLAEPRVGRGLALSDYDRDGDLDLLIVQHGEGVKLYRNDMQRGNWLQVRLRRRVGGRALGAGEGAVVIAEVGGVALRRAVTGASYLSQSSRTLHFGLAEAERAERVEVRWPGGGVDVYPQLEANSLWELTEGEPQPRRVAAPGGAGERERVVAFWNLQRAAMDAFKREGDCVRAEGLFRQALELDPGHEDSRYYLANCIAALGRPDEALVELDEMRHRNPLSHRAQKQWGILRTLHAREPADLEAAEKALERSLEINREETGSLLALGEIALLMGRDDLADQRLEWACRTNPRAAGGFFLRSYLAWKRGEGEESLRLLTAARQALGEEWKPEGAVAEGDVAKQMHREESPLSELWRSWDGGVEPDRVFPPVRDRLSERRAALR